MLKWLSIALIAATSSQAVQPELPYETEADRRNLPKTNGNVLIKNARILTVTKGTIPEGDILVENGKIVAVGKNIFAKGGVAIIDAKGKVVSPGIVDAHMHRGADAINEGTDSITGEVRMEDVLNPTSRTLYHALAGGETTGMLLHGSANIIGGQSKVIKFKYGRKSSELPVKDAPRMIKFALGENVTRSGNSSSTRFPKTRMGVQAGYRRAFTEAKAYLETWKKWNESDKKGTPPRRDLRLETLADILERKIWVQCHSYRADEMLMMVRLSQEFGFKIGAMQHALEAYKIAPELQKAGVGVSIFVDNWSFKIEGYDAIPYNAEICSKAGVLVSINTDGTNGIPALITDAAKVMRFGNLDENQALAMVTINPAKQLGVDHRVGSIEVGKDADLVIWSGHPLSVYSRVETTMIEGEIFFQRKDAHGVDKTSTFKTELTPNKKTKPLQIPTGKGAYVIQNATIYPVSGPKFVGSIRVEDGKIAQVGANVTTRGATIVNGKGLEVYPGFIDGGNSIGLNEISPIGQMVDSSELGNIQPDLIASTAVQVQSEHFPVARMNGVLASLTRPLGGTISGQASVIQNGGWTTESMRLGQDMLSVAFTGGGGGGFFENEHLDACELHIDMRQWEDDLLGGALNTVNPVVQGGLEAYFNRAVEFAKNPDPYNLQMMAMMPYIKGEKPVLLRVRSAAQIRGAVEFIKKYNLKGILSGAPDAWKVAELLKKEGIPVLIEPGGKSTLGADQPVNEWDPYDSVKAHGALLQRAGVKFAYQSNDNAGAFLLPIKVGQSCAYGLSREDALRALTLSAAEILGVADKIGSIEEGKIANLVITDGDPFELTTNIVGVFLGGKPMPLESRFTRLRNQWIQRLSEN